jgi:hypothetical protein
VRTLNLQCCVRLIRFVPRLETGQVENAKLTHRFLRFALTFFLLATWWHGLRGLVGRQTFAKDEETKLFVYVYFFTVNATVLSLQDQTRSQQSGKLSLQLVETRHCSLGKPDEFS